MTNDNSIEPGNSTKYLFNWLLTVSAVARLMPSPPDLVDSRKTNCNAPTALNLSMESCRAWPVMLPSIRSYLKQCNDYPITVYNRTFAFLNIKKVPFLYTWNKITNEQWHRITHSHRWRHKLIPESTAIQEILQKVQHFCHLGKNENSVTSLL